MPTVREETIRRRLRALPGVSRARSSAPTELLPSAPDDGVAGDRRPRQLRRGPCGRNHVRAAGAGAERVRPQHVAVADVLTRHRPAPRHPRAHRPARPETNRPAQARAGRAEQRRRHGRRRRDRRRLPPRCRAGRCAGGRPSGRPCRPCPGKTSAALETDDPNPTGLLRAVLRGAGAADQQRRDDEQRNRVAGAGAAQESGAAPVRRRARRGGGRPAARARRSGSRGRRRSWGDADDEAWRVGSSARLDAHQRPDAVGEHEGRESEPEQDPVAGGGDRHRHRAAPGPGGAPAARSVRRAPRRSRRRSRRPPRRRRRACRRRPPPPRRAAPAGRT